MNLLDGVGAGEIDLALCGRPLNVSAPITMITLVRAPFVLIQEAARVMRREGRGGAVVNVITMSSHGGTPELTSLLARIGPASPWRRARDPANESRYAHP